MAKEYYTEFIKSLVFSVNGTWRGDCVVCGGKNSLSARQEAGAILYHCYRSSCHFKGSVHREWSFKDLSRAFSNEAKENVKFELPNSFVDISGRHLVHEYLAKNHCMEAYRDGRVKLKYDIAQRRVVFLCIEADNVIDAIGRSLYHTDTPKWYRYNRLSPSDGFLCPVRMDGHSTGYTAVVVEDCASACAVSCIHNGFAILGTNLSTRCIKDLAYFDTVYLALDKDATVKSFDFQRQLQPYVETVKILPLERDLKYLNTKEIESLFHDAFID